MAPLISPVPLRDGVAAWFTGRDPHAAPPPIGAAGNLAHRRPHLPADLARARASVAEQVGVPADRWHLMRQVHGAAVGVVDRDTPPGYVLRDVDAVVTAQLDRPLVVQVADCVPVLFAGQGAIGAAHAGRRGVQAGVVPSAVAALRNLASTSDHIVAAIGPAIGGCCYEVPAPLQEEVLAVAPAAEAETTWGTPSLDLRAAVRAQLRAAEIEIVAEEPSCTRCDTRWFSHRRDPAGGRQVGLVVRHMAAGQAAS